MKLENGQLLHSATDLEAFLGCPHAAALDLEVLKGTLGHAEGEPDEYLDILKKKGDEHERRQLANLKRKGRSVIEIDQRGGAADRDRGADRDHCMRRDHRGVLATATVAA